MIAFAVRWFTISLEKICTACSVVEAERKNRNWSQSIGCVWIDKEDACTYSLGVYSPITTLSADVDAHNCLDRISVIGHFTPMNAFGLRIDSAKYSGARKWLHASANCRKRMQFSEMSLYERAARKHIRLTQRHRIFHIASGLWMNAIVWIEIDVSSVNSN